MEKWCYVVSDYCREVCPIVVFNNSLLLTENFLGGMQDLISAFLCKHEDYTLRFIIRNEEVDKLEEEGYSFLNMFTEEEEQDYIKKYKASMN